MAVVFNAPMTTASGSTDTVGSAATLTRATEATYVNDSGLLVLVSSNVSRHNSNGYLCEMIGVNEAEYSEDMGGASWTTSNTTVNTTSTTDPYGNASTTIEVQADAANGTLLQTLTHASAEWVFSVFLKRVSGSGTIEITVDGGTTWTSVGITTDWQRFSVYDAAEVNPQFGVRIVTSGDVIAMCCAQLEEPGIAGNSEPSSYMRNLTTGSTQRNYDQLTYDDPVNSCPDADGTVYLEYTPLFSGNPTSSNRNLVALDGVTGSVLYILTTGDLTGFDDTNLTSVARTSKTADVLERMAISWATSGNLRAYVDGTVDPTTNNYDGGFNRSGAALTIGAGTVSAQAPHGYIKNVRIWDEELSQTTLESYTTNGLPTIPINMYHHIRHNLG